MMCCGEIEYPLELMQDHLRHVMLSVMDEHENEFRKKLNLDDPKWFSEFRESLPVYMMSQIRREDDKVKYVITQSKEECMEFIPFVMGRLHSRHVNFTPIHTLFWKMWFEFRKQIRYYTEHADHWFDFVVRKFGGDWWKDFAHYVYKHSEKNEMDYLEKLDECKHMSKELKLRKAQLHLYQEDDDDKGYKLRMGPTLVLFALDYSPFLFCKELYK